MGDVQSSQDVSRGAEGAPARHEPIEAVPVRHPGRWVGAAVTLVLVAMLLHMLIFATARRGTVTQKRVQWDVIGQYLFSTPVLRGAVVTIELTVLSMGIGIVLGVVLAVLRLSANWLLSSAAWVYIWFFRGTPVLVQLFFWFNLSYLFPQGMSIGIPFGPSLVHINTNTVITPFVAAVMGLALNEGAYMAEIVRAGIQSVDHGQSEAAQSLGMNRMLTLRRIVLPQAMRLIIPPTGNETISMLKTSSLAAAITVVELFGSAQQIYARTYETVPLLMVASLWYLFMTSILTFGQYYLERYFSRGASRQLPPTPLQRLRRNLLKTRPHGAPAPEPPPPGLGGLAPSTGPPHG